MITLYKYIHGENFVVGEGHFRLKKTMMAQDELTTTVLEINLELE